MDLEPVGAAAVARSAFGHAYQQALAQAAGLAGGSVLLVDDALAVVLALGHGAQVVVGSAEERLQNKGFGNYEEGRLNYSSMFCLLETCVIIYF